MRLQVKLQFLVAALAITTTVGCVDDDAGRDPFVFPDTTGSMDTQTDDDTAEDADVAADADAIDDTLGSNGDTRGDVALLDTTPDVEPPISPSTAQFSYEPIDPADATLIAPAGPEDLLLATDAAWRWRSIEGVTAPSDLADPTTAAVAGADQVLIATPEGLTVASETGAVPSALSPLIDEPIVDMVSSGDGLWLLGATRVWRWSNEQLVSLDLGSFSLAGGQLAWGGRYDGTRSLWISSEDGVAALVPAAEGFQLFVERPDLVGLALACNSDGTVWGVRSGEEAWQRELDGTWESLRLPNVPQAIWAHRDARDGWLSLSDGLWHYRSGVWTAATNPAVVTTAAVDEVGRLVATIDATVQRVTPGRFVTIGGLTPGATIDTRRVLTISASAPDDIATIDVLLDGNPWAFSASGAGWTAELPMDILDSGPHSLDVTVTWTSVSESQSASLPFSVDATTWTEDMLPVFADKCVFCHNETDGASTAVLTSSTAWSQRIDCILCRVALDLSVVADECARCTDGASTMPPGDTLNEEQFRTIMLWREGGFREE